MDSFSKRFEEEIERLGTARIAEALGISRQTVYNWASSGNAPLNKLYQLQAIGFRSAYVFFGDQEESVQNNLTNELSDFATVPRYAVTASAGFGRLAAAEDVIGSLCFSRKWLQKKGLSARDLALIAVAGQSMEPVLHSGDLVLLNLADTQPRSGRAYALRQGDELLVKYCQLMPGGLLRVSSANPDFPPYDIDLGKSAAEVQVLGSVQSSMHEW